MKGINFDNTAELGEYSVMNYIQQSVMHGHKKLKWAVYEHSVKATFYQTEILECNETTPKLRQLHGCRDWMHAVCNTGVPGVVEW